MKTLSIVLIIIVVIIVGGTIFYWYGQPTTTIQTTTITPTEHTSPTIQPVSAAPANVSIANMAFNFSSIIVQKGATVTWTNNDSVPHTVTSDNSDFTSPTLSPGQTYSRVFSDIGTFSYHCAIHPSMRGSITVTQ